MTVPLYALPPSPHPPSTTAAQRNVVYSMLSCHWFGCMFYFIARVEAFNGSWDGTWVGRKIARFDGQPYYVT